MSAALTGITVLDLSRALAGPHAAMMLADQGARVIKVESPEGGDEARSWGPPFVTPADGSEPESTYFQACNRGKESIAVDLKSDAGRTALTALVEQADVLVENFRPGVLDRLGFPAERLLELNPRLVVLSITGFGHDGPEGGRAGYDQIAQGEAGLMSLTGSGPDDPQRFGVPIGDLLAGIHGAFGVVNALLERESSGQGQVVRTSLLASLVGAHAFQGTACTLAGQVGSARGNHHPTIAPYGLFRCADGHLQIAVGNQPQWYAFCELFDLDPHAPGLATNSERIADHARTVELVESVFSSRGKEELLRALTGAGVPAGRVRSLDEVYEWEQTRSQGLLVDVEHSALGNISLPGPPLRFFGPEGQETTLRELKAPPLLDEDGPRLRQWLSLPEP